MCVCMPVGERVCLGEGKSKYTDYVTYSLKILFEDFLYARHPSVKREGTWAFEGPCTTMSSYLSGLPCQLRFLFSLC